MIKTAQQSLIDFIKDVMPSLKDITFVRSNPSSAYAKQLYALWNDETNKIAERQFRKPLNMSNEDLKTLTSAGLVVEHGGNIKITQKGSEIIKQMILQDQSSAFDNGLSKTASVNKYASFGSWYKRLK